MMYNVSSYSSDTKYQTKPEIGPSMTLRDQFAMAALPAMIKEYPHITKTIIAHDCYGYADAMLRVKKIKSEQDEND